MNKELDNIKEILINTFNNAFSAGENGEELRNDTLAEEYTTGVLEHIKKHYIKRTEVEKDFSEFANCISWLNIWEGTAKKLANKYKLKVKGSK